MYDQSDDKQSDGGGGRPPLPHELTAEWTVRAQLTFARAGEPVRREYNINDPVNPVRVIYKWSNLDGHATNNNFEQQDKYNTTAWNKYSRNSTPLKPTSSTRRSHSFRSTNSSATGHGGDYGGDSAFGGSNGATKMPHKPQQSTKNKTNTATAAHYGTRCQSTCNIVVSAVADFLPPDMSSTATDYFITQEEEPEPYTFSTTASYTVLPEKSFDEYSSPATPHQQLGSYGRVLALVDAMCQTSDTETKYFEEQCSSVKPKQQRKYYEKRRATADALPCTADEGHNSLPSYTSSPGQTFKSASMSRIPALSDFLPLANQMPKTPTEGQKKPRTVHIDVYCTGSEDDEHADGEISSSGSECEKRGYEMESNSTRQTVLDNEQMRLLHRRVNDQSLPRRLVQPQRQDNMNLGHAITKSSTAEEVCESKQLLCRKHIEDQRAAKLQNLRQKYARQVSTDDVISTSYANSSRSTVSSFVPSMHADVVDASEPPVGPLTKCDSFDYDNSLDRVRIKRMERFWSRSISSGITSSQDEQQEYAARLPHAHPGQLLTTISEGNSFQRNDTLSESEHQESTPIDSPPTDFKRPGFLQFFGPPKEQATDRVAPLRTRWKSETRDVEPAKSSFVPPTLAKQQLINVQRCTSEAPPALITQTAHPSPFMARRFEVHCESPTSVRSDTSTAPSGYTPEYLVLARKFGKVVAVRKPGHHVGPTKNPSCSCESCQRWRAERFQIRARAFSLGECPVLKRPTK